MSKMNVVYTVVEHGEEFEMEGVCGCEYEKNARMIMNVLHEATARHFGVIRGDTLIRSTIPPEEMARRKGGPLTPLPN